MRILVREPSELSRYRLGLGITDFLICKRCGVFIGALMEEGDKAWFTVNANSFQPPPPDDFPLAPVDYDGEDVAARVARRKQKWTPVVEFRVGG